MTQQQKTIRKWILIVSALFALMEIMVGVALFFSPEDLLETVDFEAKGVTYVVEMWATRQLALGCAMAFAALKRSVPMLTVVYVFLLVMFMGDLLAGFMQHNSGFIATAVVMCVISGVMLLAVSNRK